jgi:sulfur-oxidizing protein SoxZ
MPEPMRIRASLAAGKVEVAAHFIQHVAVTHAGRTVLSAQWGPAVSKNPFLHFRFSGGKPGDRVVVSWTDNRGEKRTDETVIVA